MSITSKTRETYLLYWFFYILFSYHEPYINVCAYSACENWCKYNNEGVWHRMSKQSNAHLRIRKNDVTAIKSGSWPSVVKRHVCSAKKRSAL